MGVNPLPFDDRPPCFCHQNCLGFKKPTERWWVTFTMPPLLVPELGTGVLVDFTIFLPGFRECQFEPDVLPPNLDKLLLAIFPGGTIPGITIIWTLEAQVGAVTSFCTGVFNNKPCREITEIPRVPPPNNTFGDGKVFPVRWYQNANDVPH